VTCDIWSPFFSVWAALIVPPPPSRGAHCLCVDLTNTLSLLSSLNCALKSKDKSGGRGTKSGKTEPGGSVSHRLLANWVFVCCVSGVEKKQKRLRWASFALNWICNECYREPWPEAAATTRWRTRNRIKYATLVHRADGPSTSRSRARFLTSSETREYLFY